MICGAVTNELMKIVSSWQEQRSILMNKPWADLGYEIKYEDKLHSISRFGCISFCYSWQPSQILPPAFVVLERGETIQVIGGRVSEIGVCVCVCVWGGRQRRQECIIRYSNSVVFISQCRNRILEASPLLSKETRINVFHYLICQSTSAKTVLIIE